MSRLRAADACATARCGGARQKGHELCLTRETPTIFSFSACLSAGEGAWILRGADGREATGTTRAGVEADRPVPPLEGRSFVLSAAGARCSGLKRFSGGGMEQFADQRKGNIQRKL